MEYRATDTILLYIHSQLRKSGVQYAFFINVEDTDVLVLVSYVAHQLEGMLGLKRKKSIIDCALNKDISDISIPFHIHTDADTISSFYRRGQPSVFDSAMKS